MKIRIYQIEMSLDEHNVAFRSYAEMQEKYPSGISESLYRMVYEGVVPTKELSVVFYIFNMAHPQDYRARSLSVSDVIEVVEENRSTFYFCDTVGFREVSFDTFLVQRGSPNG